MLLSDPEEGGVPYTRVDFLAYHVATIQTATNIAIFNSLKKYHETPEEMEEDEGVDEVEKDSWDKWRNFPRLQEHQDFRSPEVIKLFAWLIHNFVSVFAFEKSARSHYWKVLRNHRSLAWASSDDFAFAFMGVQNGCNKWIRCYDLLQKKKAADPDFKGDDLPIKEMRNVVGSEHDSKKMGISCEEAQTRFRAIVKMYHINFCDESRPAVKENMTALYNAVQALADLEKARADALAVTCGGEQLVESPLATSRAAPVQQEAAYDPVYDAIYNGQMSQLGLGPLVPV